MPASNSPGVYSREATAATVSSIRSAQEERFSSKRTSIGDGLLAARYGFTGASSQPRASSPAFHRSAYSHVLCTEVRGRSSPKLVITIRPAGYTMSGIRASCPPPPRGSRALAASVRSSARSEPLWYDHCSARWEGESSGLLVLSEHDEPDRLADSFVGTLDRDDPRRHGMLCAAETRGDQTARATGKNRGAG